MLIIVTSIMGGFVERVKQVNREVTGDIVIECSSSAGFPHYEEMQRLMARDPNVELSTKVVQAIGLLNTTGGNLKGQIYGIIPEEYSRVTRWRESLFYQTVAPGEAVEDLAKAGFPATAAELRARADARYSDVQKQQKKLIDMERRCQAGMTIPGRGFNYAWLFLLIPVVLGEWLLVTLTRDLERWWRWVWWSFPAVGAVVAVGLATWPVLTLRIIPGRGMWII